MSLFKRVENGIISNGLLKQKVDKTKMLTANKNINIEYYQATKTVKDGVVSINTDSQDKKQVLVAFSKKIIKVPKSIISPTGTDKFKIAYDKLTKDIQSLNLLVPDMMFTFGIYTNLSLYLSIESSDYYPLTNTHNKNKISNNTYNYNVCYGRSLRYLDITYTNIAQKAYEAVCCFLSSPNNSDLRFVNSYGDLEVYYKMLSSNTLVALNELALHYLSEIDFYKKLTSNSTMTDMFRLACEHIKKAHPELYDSAKLIFLNEK